MTEWNKTQRMQERLGVKDYYQGRPIIHRDSPVDGGVYLGEGQREAIVVDSEKYPKLRELYKKAKTKATKGGTIREEEILRAVYETVKEAMPNQNNEAVNNLISKAGLQRDRKVALDFFIENGVGVCRHYALACAALLELFKKKGWIGGKISVDRNATNLGGHAWCRYTNSAGQVIILDVARNYLGSLEKGNERWDYQRPENY